MGIFLYKDSFDAKPVHFPTKIIPENLSAEKNHDIRVNDLKLQASRFFSECTRIIEQHIDNPAFGVEQFSREIGMSHSSLYKKTKETFGISVNTLIRLIRLKYATKMLTYDSCKVYEAAFCSGFRDMKYFRKKFKKIYHMTPSAFKRKYAMGHLSGKMLINTDLPPTILK